eukprot:scaffold7216_cov36-Phaeocystis_antarctica.AAC.1
MQVSQPCTCAPKLGENPPSSAEPSPSTPVRPSESLRGMPADRQIAVACIRRCIATCIPALQSVAPDEGGGGGGGGGVPALRPRRTRPRGGAPPWRRRAA